MPGLVHPRDGSPRSSKSAAELKTYDTRMHIALTRATVGAVIMCDEEMLRLDERLRRVAAAARCGW